MASKYRPWIDALRESNAHLAEFLGTPDGVDVASATYCPGWSVAHLLRHFGSGAEIGLLNLRGALSADEPPPRSLYGEIIAAWASKPEERLAQEALARNDLYVDTLDALDDDSLDALRVRLRGRDLDVAAFVGRRLFEHALHTWDIEVMRNPLAVLTPEAATLLVDRVIANLDMLSGGRGTVSPPVRVGVSIEDSGKAFILEAGPEAVNLEAAGLELASLRSSAEAFVRLLSGRLDVNHTPASLIASPDEVLEQLRGIFAGVPTPTEPA